MRVIILAQGLQLRMRADLDVPKQLVPLPPAYKVPLLERTFRLLEMSGVDRSQIDVAAWGTQVWRDFCAASRVRLSPWTNVGKGVLDALHENILWRGGPWPTVMLLGDVFWSLRALQLALQPGFALTGRLGGHPWNGRTWGELFALTVDAPGEAALVEWLASNDRFHPPHAGRLWNLYHRMGVSLRNLDTPWANGTQDWTDDLDAPDDVAALPNWIATIRRMHPTTPGFE